MRITEKRIKKWQERIIRAQRTIYNVLQEADQAYPVARGRDLQFIQELRGDLRLANKAAEKCANRLNYTTIINKEITK